MRRGRAHEKRQSGEPKGREVGKTVAVGKRLLLVATRTQTQGSIFSTAAHVASPLMATTTTPLRGYPLRSATERTKPVLACGTCRGKSWGVEHADNRS